MNRTFYLPVVSVLFFLTFAAFSQGEEQGKKSGSEKTITGNTANVATAKDYSGFFKDREATDWKGFKKYQFSFQNRQATIVVPQKAAEGKPWIWRARFFGHEPQTDIALLNKGYHLVYLNSVPMLGAPCCVERWQNFYLFLTEKLGFNKKANLEGMSRGGLYVINWAYKYPNQVASIYIDNPVLDFKSWPGGKGKAKGTPSEWANILRYYGFSEKEAMEYKLNPVDIAPELAKKKVPILILCADADKAVPYEENTKIFAEKYKAAGGSIEVIMKPGFDHHPHSLPDPAPIVNFILKYNK
ncbi:MAG: prolyl oligopeptidase family serine peptidase [Planctomycetia bacterium]|nr:prolyl oligopeptidase family serine peptidase [Planctomycetia bacterium]